MCSSPAGLPAPEGPGSVSGAPHLPAGFTGTFTSRYVDTGDLRQHVVTGGGGPPLLLVHGWPQTWYAWRLVMPALAQDFFTVTRPTSRSRRSPFSTCTATRRTCPTTSCGELHQAPRTRKPPVTPTVFHRSRRPAGAAPPSY